MSCTKKTVVKRSAVPIYGVAAVWVIWCLVLPLYSLLHFLLLIAVSAGAYLALTKLFPGKKTVIDVPAEPVSTGNAEADALLREGELAVKELRRLGTSIREPSVRSRVEEISSLTDKIFKDIIEDPNDIPQVRRFAGYYLPTTMKLLNAYDRMSGEGAGENVSGTLKRIEDILDTTVAAYRKEYDHLFANEALDIDTDITVLESMLKREGLTGKDFDVKRSINKE